MPPANGLISAANDGSAELLGILDGDLQTYREWAENYHEREIPLDAIRRVYGHEALGEGLLAALNAELTLADIAADVSEIGYPVVTRP